MYINAHEKPLQPKLFTALTLVAVCVNPQRQHRFRHCLAKIQPESLSDQDLSEIPELLTAGKKVTVWDFSL